MSMDRMIIDEQMPVYDLVVAEHLIVGADPMTTFKRTGAPLPVAA